MTFQSLQNNREFTIRRFHVVCNHSLSKLTQTATITHMTQEQAKEKVQ